MEEIGKVSMDALVKVTTKFWALMPIEMNSPNASNRIFFFMGMIFSLIGENILKIDFLCDKKILTFVGYNLKK
jgi:hypothetical protein